MNMSVTMDPPSYQYVMPPRASTDASFMDTLLYLHQQQVANSQGVFPYPASSPHEDPLAARFSPLISFASQFPSKMGSAGSLPGMLATRASTLYDEESIVRALSMITSAPCPLSSPDVPNLLSQQLPLLMGLAELQRKQQQQRQTAELNAVLQHQRQELCRASLGLSRHASPTHVVHHSDAPPVLERQSPEKPSSPKKRRHHGENPSAKRFQASEVSPATGIRAANVAEAIVKDALIPSALPGGSAILQQLIEDDSPDGDLEQRVPMSCTVNSDSPHRHHPNYLPKRDPEAALLEDYATVYMLNGFGGLCANRLEKSLEEALFDMPSDSSSPSTDNYLPNVRRIDSAYASPMCSRASSNTDSNQGINIL